MVRGVVRGVLAATAASHTPPLTDMTVTTSSVTAVTHATAEASSAATAREVADAFASTSASAQVGARERARSANPPRKLKLQGLEDAAERLRPVKTRPTTSSVRGNRRLAPEVGHCLACRTDNPGHVKHVYRGVGRRKVVHSGGRCATATAATGTGATTSTSTDNTHCTNAIIYATISW